ncbi:MAG: omptin family outer membrane protease [Treponema sp.]|nr:omptin family outer membrane protease [Treponema sp.]
MKIRILAAVMAAGLGWTAAADEASLFLATIQGNEYAPYASVETGAAFVKLHEWVFREPGSDAKISAIDYDMGFQGCFRLGLGFEPYNKLKKIGLGISGVYASYLPMNGGSVSDSDWDDNGVLFSMGTGTASSAAFTDIEGRLQLYIPLGKITALVLMAKLWYCRYAASANDGWMQQAYIGESLDDSLPKKPLYGMSMMYIQEWLSIAPGLGLWLQLGPHSVNLYAAVWGGVWGCHLDYHFFRKINPSDSMERYVIYKDNVKGNLAVSVEAEWKYQVKRYGEIGVTLGYKAVPKARGSSRIMTAGLVDDVYYEADAAGASIIQIYGGVSYKLWL